MKVRFWKIVIIIVLIVLLIVGFLFHKRIIWFVYPDKSTYPVDGLDVSHHQGKIDWEKVDKKYQFVFVKATEGDTFVDTRFDENVINIKNTRRILGAYHFFHFNYGGLEQANNFINTVGNNIDLPPVVDFEFTGNPDRFDKLKVSSELKICIDKLEKYYKDKVIIYVTRDSYKHFIEDNFDNPIWYRSIILPLNKKIKNVLFWQYHNSAIIEGVTTKVDLNVFKGNITELNELIME
jgi:lysozyme